MQPITPLPDEAVSTLLLYRKYISERANALGNADSSVYAALGGLNVIHFPIDGSMQLQVIYEQAAEKSVIKAALNVFEAPFQIQIQIEMDETERILTS